MFLSVSLASSKSSISSSFLPDSVRRGIFAIPFRCQSVNAFLFRFGSCRSDSVPFRGVSLHCCSVATPFVAIRFLTLPFRCCAFRRLSIRFRIGAVRFFSIRFRCVSSLCYSVSQLIFAPPFRFAAYPSLSIPYRRTSCHRNSRLLRISAYLSYATLCRFYAFLSISISLLFCACHDYSIPLPLVAELFFSFAFIFLCCRSRFLRALRLLFRPLQLPRLCRKVLPQAAISYLRDLPYKSRESGYKALS